MEEGGTNVYINNSGHMTKMAAMSIYCKTLQKSSSPGQVDQFQQNLVCSAHYRLEYYNVYINYDPVMTLTFMARST